MNLFDKEGEYPMVERRAGVNFEERQRYAREEFAQWREENPDFTSKELIDKWKRIRISWGVSEQRKGKKGNYE